MEIFEQIVLYPGIYLYVIVTSIRVWFLWYDLNVSKLQLQRAWRMVINPNSESEDWYFNNLATWGNPYLILRYGFIFAISFSVITVVLYLLGLDLFKWLVALFCLLIEVVFVLIMWLKMRTFYYDNLGIKKEFLYFWIVVFGFISIGVIGGLLAESNYINNNNNNNNKNSGETKGGPLFWACFILFFVNCLLFGLIPLPKWLIKRAKLKETKKILKRQKSRELEQQAYVQSLKQAQNALNNIDINIENARSTSNTLRSQAGTTTDNKRRVSTKINRAASLMDKLPRLQGLASASVGSGADYSSGTRSNGSSRVASPRNNNYIDFAQLEAVERQHTRSSWAKIIVTEYGYESFMSHLEREFSVENCLFVTEVCFAIVYINILDFLS